MRRARREARRDSEVAIDRSVARLPSRRNGRGRTTLPEGIGPSSSLRRHEVSARARSVDDLLVPLDRDPGVDVHPRRVSSSIADGRSVPWATADGGSERSSASCTACSPAPRWSIPAPLIHPRMGTRRPLRHRSPLSSRRLHDAQLRRPDTARQPRRASPTSPTGRSPGLHLAGQLSGSRGPEAATVEQYRAPQFGSPSLRGIAIRPPDKGAPRCP
jgi:hypothetical protein